MTARRIVVSFSCAAALVVLVAIAITGKGNDAYSEGATRTASACREFNETVADTRSGVIADHEVERRMQKVYDTGRGSASDVARATFTEFQRARLKGERAALYNAINNMSALCHTKW